MNFKGLGTAELICRRLGAECRWSSEIDKHAAAVARYNEREGTK